MCCLSNLAGENKKYVFQTGIRYFRQNVKMSKRQNDKTSTLAYYDYYDVRALGSGNSEGVEFTRFT